MYRRRKEILAQTVVSSVEVPQETLRINQVQTAWKYEERQAPVHLLRKTLLNRCIAW